MRPLLTLIALVDGVHDVLVLVVGGGEVGVLDVGAVLVDGAAGLADDEDAADTKADSENPLQ